MIYNGASPQTPLATRGMNPRSAPAAKPPRSALTHSGTLRAEENMFSIYLVGA